MNDTLPYAAARWLLVLLTLLAIIALVLLSDRVVTMAPPTASTVPPSTCQQCGRPIIWVPLLCTHGVTNHPWAGAQHMN